MAVDRTIDQFVPGPEGLAGCHDLGGVLLSTDAPVSSGRVVRIDVANQARSRLSSGQYCGRSWAGKYRQFRTTSANLTRFSKGIGNAPAFGGACRHPAGGRLATGSGSVRELRQNA